MVEDGQEDSQEDRQEDSQEGAAVGRTHDQDDTRAVPSDIPAAEASREAVAPLEGAWARGCKEALAHCGHTRQEGADSVVAEDQHTD